MKSYFLNRRNGAKRILLFSAILLFLFSIISAYYFKVQPSVNSERKRLEGHIQEQQRDYEAVLQDTVLMRQLVQKTESLKTFERIANKEYGIFLFVENINDGFDLLFWSNQKVLPSPSDYRKPDGEYFQQLTSGNYLIQKRTILLPGMSNTIIAYAIFPIEYKYNNTSAYLLSHFVYDKQAVNKIATSILETPYPIRSLHKKVLFYINSKAYGYVEVNDMLTSASRIGGFVLLLAYFYFVALNATRKKGPVKGVLFLTVLLITIRLILFYYPGIFLFRQFQLFDPTIFSTNWVNASLGDLLINALFFCWLVVFAWYHVGHLTWMPRFLYGKRMVVAGVVALLFLMLATFELATVVRSLVADSKLSFNVTDFFSLDVYTIIGFVILASISLGYYYFTRLLFHFIFPAFNKSAVFTCFLLAFTGLSYLTVRTDNNIVLFQLPVLLWLIIYTLIFSQSRLIINRFKITIAGILFWIFIFSVSLTTIILQENQKKELLLRKSIADNYDESTNPSSERMLSIAITYLDSEFLYRNFQRFNNYDQNHFLRDSIINENVIGYRNKYDTRIFVFDSVNKALYNGDPLTFEQLNNIFIMQSRHTGIPGLFYHQTSFDKYTYITKRVVRDTSAVLGSFFIVSTPKKYGNEAIYPELFRRMSQSDPESSPVYSYAIYKDGLLIRSSSKYSFQITLMPDQIPSEEFERRLSNGFDELWYKAANGKVVIVVKKLNSLIESITLFSWLFCAFLLMVALLQFIALLLKAADDLRVLNVFRQLNIRTQVHSTIIFISILSFFIIGIASISFFIDRYNRNNEDKLSHTAGIMVKEMQKQLADRSTFDDVMKIYDTASNAKLQQLINEVVDIHDVDINVYTPEGDLRVSSEKEVYERGILSNKMHPKAYYHLKRLRQVQYVQEETLSSLNYLSIYATVRDEKGEPYAYLNIPYFLSQFDINQEISNFLITIINLNAFIFLIAGVIALFITNKITRSFSVIGNKMKEITLGKTAEEIDWNRNDEIGELVIQYNKMVHQLEESAAALAKSEREGAWREMARQVAHEIKNPLTPMKLSVQFLQKANNNNQANVKELTSSVANTLVEQIDHLSKIAADFSQFANLGIRNLEVFDLHQVLEVIKDLYSTYPNVQFVWHKVDKPLTVKADRTQMNRLFTNLITNAIDACEHTENCRIEMAERIDDKKIIIELKDNGAGIEKEMHGKIFTPNFTTKTSGTGLGLAMCKSIVEQAEGKLQFETEVKKGTSFFVQLPLAD